MPARVMGILLEIAPWTETRLEKGRKGRKARGKEFGVVKEVRVTGKEKERGKDILGPKDTKGTIREKAKGKGITGECLRVEKDTRGFVLSVVRRDTKLEKDCVKYKRSGVVKIRWGPIVLQ